MRAGLLALLVPALCWGQLSPSNSAAENSDAWDARMATVAGAGAALKVPLRCGDYYFARQLDVIREVDMVGPGGGPIDPCVQFFFPAGSHGIYLHFAHGAGGNDRSDGSRVGNIRVRAQGKTTVRHGIVVKAPVQLENIHVYNFAGDGVHTQANLPEASASLAVFRNVSSTDNGVTRAVASTSMAGDDITVNTSAAHNLEAGDIVFFYRGQVEIDTGPMERVVTSVTDADTFVVAGWALYENAAWEEWVPTQIKTGNGFFTSGGDANGIRFDSCQTYTNEAWGNYDDSFLGNTHVGELADGNEIGAYYSIKSTARTTWIGCYSELSNPQSSITWPSVVFGGDQGAHIYGDFVGANSGLYNPMQIPTFTPSGTVGHKVFIGDIAAADPALMRIRTANGDDYRVRYDYGNSEFGGWDKLLSWWNYANVTGAAFATTTSSTVWPNGRAAENSNIGKIVYTFGFYLAHGSHWTEGAAAPVAGAHQAGDRVWRYPPEVGQPQFWVCTVDGTPGTWVAGPNL